MGASRPQRSPTPSRSRHCFRIRRGDPGQRRCREDVLFRSSCLPEGAGGGVSPGRRWPDSNASSRASRSASDGAPAPPADEHLQGLSEIVPGVSARNRIQGRTQLVIRPWGSSARIRRIRPPLLGWQVEQVTADTTYSNDPQGKRQSSGRL